MATVTRTFYDEGRKVHTVDFTAATQIAALEQAAEGILSADYHFPIALDVILSGRKYSGHPHYSFELKEAQVLEIDRTAALYGLKLADDFQKATEGDSGDAELEAGWALMEWMRDNLEAIGA